VSADEACGATWGEPGNGELDCELPAGHEGQHYAEIHWDQVTGDMTWTEPISPGYEAYLVDRYSARTGKAAVAADVAGTMAPRDPQRAGLVGKSKAVFYPAADPNGNRAERRAAKRAAKRQP
jgi:hypothetical protein